jgi:hypothetical protein
MNQIVFPNKFIDQTGFYANEKLSLDFANYDRMKNDFDGTFDNFNNPDTPLNVSTSEQFRLGFSPVQVRKRRVCVEFKF